MEWGTRRTLLLVLGAAVAITAIAVGVSSAARSVVLPFPVLLWIQLFIGLLVAGYGVQQVIFPRQNARAFRPWVDYHPVTMIVLGVFATAIGLVFTVSAVAQLVRHFQQVH